MSTTTSHGLSTSDVNIGLLKINIVVDGLRAQVKKATGIRLSDIWFYQPHSINPVAMLVVKTSDFISVKASDMEEIAERVEKEFCHCVSFTFLPIKRRADINRGLLAADGYISPDGTPLITPKIALSNGTKD